MPTSLNSAETKLSLLGGLEFRHAGNNISIPVAGQRLLAFLALHDWHQHRSVIAGTLWMDICEERAAARLRTALWRIRQVGAGLIRSEGPFLRMATDIRVDLTDLVGATRALVADPYGSGEPGVTAAMLAQDLLPQWHDDWVVVERERLRQLRLHGLEALCRRLTTQGRHAAAIDAGLRAVQIEPLRETAQRALIAAHLGTGNQAAALHQYRAFRDLLHVHLGIEPGPEIRALLHAGLRGQPASTR